MSITESNSCQTTILMANAELDILGPLSSQWNPKNMETLQEFDHLTDRRDGSRMELNCFPEMLVSTGCIRRPNNVFW